MPNSCESSPILLRPAKRTKMTARGNIYALSVSRLGATTVVLKSPSSEAMFFFAYFCSKALGINQTLHHGLWGEYKPMRALSTMTRISMYLGTPPVTVNGPLGPPVTLVDADQFLDATGTSMVCPAGALESGIVHGIGAEVIREVNLEIRGRQV